MRDKLIIGGSLGLAAAASLTPVLGLANMQPPQRVRRPKDKPSPKQARANDKREKRKAQKAARAVTKRKGR